MTPFESADDGFDSVLLVTGLDATAEGLSVDGFGVWLDLGVSFVMATSDGSGRRAGLESVDGRGVPFEVPGVGRYAFVAIGERRSSVALRFGAGGALPPLMEASRSLIGILSDVTQSRKAAAQRTKCDSAVRVVIKPRAKVSRLTDTLRF